MATKVGRKPIDKPLTFAQLVQFHREVVMPDIRHVVGELRQEMAARFTAVDGHFDEVCRRFDRLELKARVDGLQEQIRVLESRLSA